MSFLSPFLLWGLGLATIPVIIHLLNRRRFTVVEWAPMEFLRQTIRTNRRRVRFEQWLLLAVRTLVILCLIFAISRPLLTGGRFDWLGGSNRVSHVLVVDDSLSLQYLDRGSSAWERSRVAARDLVEAMSSQDTITVFMTSEPDRPLVREVLLTDPAAVVGAIDERAPTATANDMSAVFDAVDRALEGAQYPVRAVTVITDLRRQGWGPSIQPFARRWAADDAEPVELTIVDVGVGDTDNVRIASLRLDDPVALPDQPTRFVAEIHNDTARVFGPASMEVTSGARSEEVLVPQIGAGESGEVFFTRRFETTGEHALTARLAPDRLPGDDIRHTVVDVRERLELLIVDGEPEEAPFASESDFLALSYAIGEVPWRVRRVVDSEWFEEPSYRTHPFDLVILANVGSIPSTVVDALEARVNAGTGLIIFAGDQFDLDEVRRHWYRDGEGLLPLALRNFSDEPARGWSVEALESTPLRSLARVSAEALAQIQTRRLLVLDDARLPDEARVLARWGNAAATPAVVERRFGRGRVLFFNVTADKAWSDWPLDPTFVLTVREAGLEIVRGARRSGEVLAGAPVTVSVATSVDAGRVVLPDESEPRTLSVLQPQSPTATLVHRDTITAGVHRLSWDVDGVTRTHRAAVNPDPAESQLDRLDEATLRTWTAPLAVDVIPVGSGALFEGEGREFWRTLAIALFALVVVESILARWVGRSR